MTKEQIDQTIDEFIDWYIAHGMDYKEAERERKIIEQSVEYWVEQGVGAKLYLEFYKGVAEARVRHLKGQRAAH